MSDVIIRKEMFAIVSLELLEQVPSIRDLFHHIRGEGALILNTKGYVGLVNPDWMDSVKEELERLRVENKRVNDLCQDFNAQLLEERLQKTCEYAQTNDQLRERIEELEEQNGLLLGEIARRSEAHDRRRG